MPAYSYLLHHKPTNTFYYGVRWAKDCHPDEFWRTYFTSSKKNVPLLRTLFGDDSFEFEIRRVFKSGKKAADWEHKVLRRMRVLDKPDLWLNRTTNTSWLYDINPFKGKHHSNETRQRIATTLVQKSIRPPNTRGMTPWNKGIPHSEEQKKKMSGKKWINNGTLERKIHNEEKIPTGWKKGRML
jgi:hypothetical protein